MRDRKLYHDPDLKRDKEGQLWITTWRAPEKSGVTRKALRHASAEAAQWRAKP